ncbi:hypothetical protein JTE90_029716 [Oedothorax gibbosus]|uniref:Uncharacterized protein n=1 Tax=Oedothorax gibbosus TaxID=931172 RepID=A0AAV6TIV7_9ARAC|nr:hypothetical protein JTE90_029716 [Oedothorax gibbosus]
MPPRPSPTAPGKSPPLAPPIGNSGYGTPLLGRVICHLADCDDGPFLIGDLAPIGPPAPCPPALPPGDDPPFEPMTTFMG